MALTKFGRETTHNGQDSASAVRGWRTDYRGRYRIYERSGGGGGGGGGGHFTLNAAGGSA